MRLEVAAEIFQEESYVIAYAKALDLSSCGKTESEAIQALMEATRLFVVTSLEMGTLDQILHESGYRLHGDEWIMSPETECWSPENIISISDVTRRCACVEI